MITNTIEIRVYGLMRSGNHAIIDWIKNQYGGQAICFLNNIKHGDLDPYHNYAQKVLGGIDDHVDNEALRKQKKDLLIYSYEDQASLESEKIDFLTSIFHLDFENNREVYLGKSQYHYDVVIIRDPFNCFASRLTAIDKRGTMGGVGDMALVAHNWKILAKHVLAIDAHSRPDKIVIKYNPWAIDRSYREDISRQLKGIFNDTSIDTIPPFGGGSSFILGSSLKRITVYDLLSKWRLSRRIMRLMRLEFCLKRLGIPRRLDRNDFFQRWRLLEANENFKRLFLDKEILELSEMIFGEIPGTREFMRSLDKNPAPI